MEFPGHRPKLKTIAFRAVIDVRVSCLANFPLSFRVGSFDADPETGELRKSGRKLHLQEKPFQVLVALLEHRRISRKALQERLWPRDTFVNFDNGLNTANSKLRGASYSVGCGTTALPATEVGTGSLSRQRAAPLTAKWLSEIGASDCCVVTRLSRPGYVTKRVTRWSDSRVHPGV